MTTYGYGAKEEKLYMKAYELATSGKPTLLFSFEASKKKLYDIFTSHLLKIDIKDVTPEKTIELQQKLEPTGKIPLYFIDVASMPVEEIENQIGRVKASSGITDVVLDRVDRDDASQIRVIGRKLGVQIHFEISE